MWCHPPLSFSLVCIRVTFLGGRSFKGPFSGRHQDYRPYRFVKESSKFKTVFLWLSINFIPWKFIHHLFGTWKTSFSRLEISTSPAIMRNLSFKKIILKFREFFQVFPQEKIIFTVWHVFKNCLRTSALGYKHTGVFSSTQMHIENKFHRIRFMKFPVWGTSKYFSLACFRTSRCRTNL